MRVVRPADETTALAVGPVGGSAVSEAEVGRPSQLPDLGIVLPERLTRRWIDSHINTKRRGCVEDAVHHDRRVLITRGPGHGIGLGNLVVWRAPAPGDLQLFDVGPRDLAKRRVLGARGIDRKSTRLNSSH